MSRHIPYLPGLLAAALACCAGDDSASQPAAPQQQPAAGPGKLSLEGVEVRGDLPQEELLRLVAAALAHEEVDPPVISVTVADPDHAEVHTGEIRGPLDGAGATVILERRDGEWVVTEVAHWIS